MKIFKLNFKGLYGYRQSLLSRSPQPRDNQEMSERRPSEERTLLTPLLQRFARYAAMLIMLLTLGVGQMWGWSAFYLYGNYQNSWDTKDKVNLDGTISDGKYFIPVYHNGTTKYFRLYKDNHYGPADSHELPAGGEKGDYNGTTYAWYISSTDKKLICICIDQKGNSDSHPWVWARDAEVYLKHTWSSSSWTYSDKMTVNTTNGTYTLDRNYPTYSSNNGYNCSVVPATDGGTKRDGAAITPTKVGSPASGNKCRYVYDASAGTLTITKLCTVKYNGNDKTSGTVPSDNADNLYDAYITLSSNTLSKNGYTHTGWNTAADGSGTHYDKGASFQVKDATQTLYAEWTASVTLAANGGNNGGSASVFYKDDALNITTTPTHATAGYTIRGYYAESGCTNLVADKDGNLADATVSGFITSGKWVATEAKTLHTKWDNHYTVTFDQGTPTIQGTENTTATYGQAMPAITVPSKTGYIFGGYYTGTNGTGTKYYEANGESANNWAIAANTTLHAKWTGITYYVAFDANEGTGSMDNQDFTYGVAEDLDRNDNSITRSGYYFLGWNTKADGSGTQYKDHKNVINLTTIDGGIVTLYAQWAKTYTVYFVLAGIGWNPPYAKAKITFDDQTSYPITGSDVWSSMSEIAEGITLSNASHGSGADKNEYKLYKIDNVPEGASIDFSDNGSSAVGYMSWEVDKPYFVYGNRTWYALDATSPKRTIAKATEMSVHLVELDSKGAVVSAYDYGINQYTEGLSTVKYAIAELKASTHYKYKYFNWIPETDVYSGYGTADLYIMNEKTTTGYSTLDNNNGYMNSSPGQDIHFFTTCNGEYKFMLTWDNTTPITQMYYPVDVSLGISISEALAGTSTTVTLTASSVKTYLMTSPTYYYQMSTDNGKTWTTIAETSSTTYDYTFAAQKCKFRVILKNDAGLRSTSGTQDFSTYSTKSFYVYNPYNTSGNWSWLHLYTWDSNHNNDEYNGSFPSGSPSNDCGYIHGVDNEEPKNCRNGNNLRYVGNNWFYITIDERANCFMLVGEATYKDHQTVTCYVNNYIEGGKYMIYTRSNANYVEAYQAKGASDYRLKYTYGSPAKYRYSPIYNTTLDGATVTTSMWMNAADGTSLTIQQGSGNNTWADKKTYTNSSDGFGGIVPEGYRDHGYVFQMQINFNTGTPTNSTISTPATVSSGPFYVRTDGLTGGWNVYKKADHTMHHSAASLTSGSPAYDYYLCKWVGTAGTNVKFTVADDYNPELVESLEGDKNSTDPLYNRQTLPIATNVRFSWNSRTNTLTRSYLSGSSAASDRFLVLVEMPRESCPGKIYNDKGQALVDGEGQVSGLNEHELIFSDMGNWVYQIIMIANPGAQAKVTAKYNSQEAEFIPTTSLISGSGATMYTYRIIYDFKTNELTNAWVPDGTDITSEIDLNTNVMIIRNGQDAGIQIHFTGSGKVIHAKKLLGVMEFAYNDMVGNMSSWNTAAYEHCMYYISFPYDVKVSDIFGIGEMGIDWRLQYYDGAERASKGFFRGDGTTTFWKDVPADGTLKANVGYSLLLNRVKFNDKTSDLWENKTSGSKLYLYFPSQKSFEGDSIIATGTKTISVPSHECTINRTFETESGTVSHKFTDSHWNMMGMPLFENQSNVETSKFVTTKADQTTPFETNTGYFYEWTPSTNSLAVRSTSGYQFKSMHGYMVQFTGSVQFSGSSLQPKPSVVARRQKQEAKNYTVELELLRENEHTSRAYVELRNEACDTFALNEDLYMQYTSMPADIYTMAGNYDVSANVLSVQNHTIPVGVEVHKAGSFTFSMPSYFDGTVTLIDTYAQTRTNLAIEDYEVTLSKGNITDRFFIEIDLNKMPTAIDGVEGGSLKDGKAHKFIENGEMYILKDGEIFDARGAKVK